ncbi:AT-hook motif nuclear-localized protein 17-like [Andrographis paniculata]|uniref:AT-hook motif nuclear-localized protein 17-like n=1 Tax=Andrographis paniculata TaxID=175694 RepID=UPI0021E93124|nr:AT-hook motif nuclear-localized protein 17-like [Andrographis paniculata]
MKRERPEDHHHLHHHHSNGGAGGGGIFSNQFPLHSPPPHLRRSSTSDETDSHDSTRRNPSEGSFPPPPLLTTNDGATIEVVRRPRGRPPGSKNKPKPPSPSPATAAREPEPSMGPYILELPAGVDVVESTAKFCRRRNVGLCVLSGHGAVANVALKQPSATPGATVAFHGRFDILSISATVVPAGGLPAGNGAFTLFLAGPQGQVVGGLVVGPLISAGTIYLIAATFDSPLFVRLQPAEQEEEPEAARDHHRESPRGGDSGGAPIYSYQPSDVIWAPTARQPPPY